MNKTKDRPSVNIFSAMVKQFCNPLFGQWNIGKNVKNISKRLATQKQLDESSGYSYFRFWCRNQSAVL